MSESDWSQGNRAAYNNMLTVCLRAMGVEHTDRAQLATQLEDVRQSLRMICADFGIDNSWPDDLHLGDVIEKWVRPQIEERNYAARIVKLQSELIRQWESCHFDRCGCLDINAPQCEWRYPEILTTKN